MYVDVVSAEDGEVQEPEEESDGDETYHTQKTTERLAKAMAARAGRLLEQQKLPRLRKSLADFVGARGADNELQRLTELLPPLDAYETGLGRQAAVAIASYRAGLTASCNLTTGGFDTHGDHDNRHANALNGLTAGVNELWTEVEAHGLEDQVVVIIHSDFGRTPGYNSGNGKDHWPITSMVLMGAGIRGNRVIGSSTERHLPINVDKDSLRPVQGDGGVRITPAHIHLELRKLAGIEEDKLVALNAPLGDLTPLKLFS